MPYSFPASPSVDDTHLVGDTTFVWDGKRWRAYDLAAITGGGEGVPSITNLGNVGATEAININAADVQILTLDAASCTLSFTGTAPAGGTVRWVTLRIVHDNTSNSRAITWPTVAWENTTAPFFPAADANAYITVTLMFDSAMAATGYHTGTFYP